MMNNDENATPTFHVYEVAKELARACRPLIERIERRDRSLADQARRAAQSVMLNVREGNRRAGRDRLHSFRIAAGSADEVVGALDVAEVRLPGARRHRGAAGARRSRPRDALPPRSRPPVSGQLARNRIGFPIGFGFGFRVGVGVGVGVGSESESGRWSAGRGGA